MKTYSARSSGRQEFHSTGALDDILKRARRRYFANLLLNQAGIALSVGAVGVLLLLVLGTQILDWQWPVFLCLAVFAFGAYRVRRKVLPPYRIAQLVDQLLSLEDRLSTAFYFRHLAVRAPALVETVEAQAMRQAQPADVDRAIPYRFPRSGYVAVALCVAAMTTLGVRYGILRSLDLRQPLANITFDTFRDPPKVEAASRKKSVIQEHLEKQLQQMGLSLDQQQEIDKEGEKPATANVEAVANEPGGNEKGEPGKGPNSAMDGKKPNEGENQSAGAQAGESKDQASGEPTEAQKQPQQGAPNPKNASAGKNGGNNPGVMDKMKDALANLMNKLGAKSQESSQESASSQSQQQGGQQQAGQKGNQGQGRSQADSQQSPDPDGKSDAADGEKTAGQKAQSKESNQQGGENAKSGMGKQDGDKAIRDAEQLAAMGKISEIFGKRAAEIQGEMSVEVPSGKQQLKTAYSRSLATHSGAVADSNRNEIPLIYQTYVQRYFEEVRKTAKPKTATP